MSYCLYMEQPQSLAAHYSRGLTSHVHSQLMHMENMIMTNLIGQCRTASSVSEARFRFGALFLQVSTDVGAGSMIPSTFTLL